MDFLKVKTVDQAKKDIRKCFSEIKLKTITVDLPESLGRTLAEDITSTIDVPEFNRSTVDGYAINCNDCFAATESVPSQLILIGSVEMGEVCTETVITGQTVYVPTGGIIPGGADAVVMLEYVEQFENTVLISKPVPSGANIVYKSDDISKGQVVLKKGIKIKAQALGAIAAIGINKVNVLEQIRVTIISTGDELVSLDKPLTKGKIRDINSYSLEAKVKECGGVIVNRSIIKDDFNSLLEATNKGVDGSHITIISGGSSVGTKDYSYDVINSLDNSAILLHGLAIKPGKPTIVGTSNKKLVVGLPGHPVSAIVVFDILIGPLFNNERSYTITAKIDSNIHSTPGKDSYHPVSLSNVRGTIVAKKVLGKSGLITVLTKSDGLFNISANSEGVYKDSTINVQLI